MHNADGISALVKCVGKWAMDAAASNICAHALGALKFMAVLRHLSSLERAELQSLEGLSEVSVLAVQHAIIQVGDFLLCPVLMPLVCFLTEPLLDVQVLLSLEEANMSQAGVSGAVDHASRSRFSGRVEGERNKLISSQL